MFEAADRVNDARPGLVENVIRRGLVELLFRTWDRSTGKLVAEFDFGRLKGDTRYPFAVQCEQDKLAGMAIARLRDFPHANVEFSARVSAVRQTSDGVEIDTETAASTRTAPTAAARPCARRSLSRSTAIPILSASLS